ncbi:MULTISPECIES: RNA ligase family protein [Streptosporangium]|uniref:RNA ligase domain-containing protein n=1 Tax=Streptosporangium brasiliense TaxID=47480 RepID=A0ABT9RM23_9ACTN|nr:RNA ligase family protein [Streptosporangium brasiliense]MDP9870344.1 hypothetical protein [Streptosporangium brasiliense]
MYRLRQQDLEKINSLTKYPSIPTHHALNPRAKGILLEEPTEYEGTVIGTEKVDGTNARLIVLPDGRFLIGSRGELLTCSGDRVHNPQQGIVDALREVGYKVEGAWDEILVLYLEVYGGKQLPEWKQYGDGTAAFRLFDAATVDPDRISMDHNEIAMWRDRGGQDFAGEAALQAQAKMAYLLLTPRLFTLDAAELPRSIAGMREFMAPYAATRVSTGTPGRSEGIVLRSHDRRVISKARFKDYDKTLRMRAEAEQAIRANV